MASSSADGLIRQLREMGVDDADGTYAARDLHSPPRHTLWTSTRVNHHWTDGRLFFLPLAPRAAVVAVQLGARNVAEAFNLITARAEQQRWGALLRTALSLLVTRDCPSILKRAPCLTCARLLQRERLGGVLFSHLRRPPVLFQQEDWRDDLGCA